MPKMMRIGTAFLAGVLVALAGAFIYVRTASVKPVDVRPSNMKPVDQPAPPASPPPGKQIVVDTPQPKPETIVKQEAPSRATVSHVAVKKHAPAPIHHRAPVPAVPQQLAQIDRPAPVAPVVPAPVPAVPAVPPKQVQTGPGPQYDSPQPPPDTQREQTPSVSSAAPQPQAPSPPEQRHPMTVTLDAGTQLSIRLGETLSTNTNYTGDTFRGTLESPIVRDGYIIADRGSMVFGTIVNAHKAGRMSGQPQLTLALTEINTTDGQRVHVQTNTVSRAGPSSTPETTAKVAAGAAIGAIIGAIAGGGKGAAIGAGAGGAAGTGAAMAGHSKPAVIPTEAQLTFSLTQPVTITEKLH